MRFLLLLTLLGCADGEEEIDQGACAEEPVVTWDNFGAGFLTENCQACHASSNTDNRNNAPTDIFFDTEQDLWDRAALVRDVALGNAPQMPPSGGISEDDRVLLDIWLRCDAPE